MYTLKAVIPVAEVMCSATLGVEATVIVWRVVRSNPSSPTIWGPSVDAERMTSMVSVV